VGRPLAAVVNLPTPHPPERGAPTFDVDLVLLSRDLGPPRDDVRRGIESQAGVRLRVHRVTGQALPGDPNRWETIARARNEAKARGTNPWVVFLDDDVVLAPDCVATLLDGLRSRPGFAALGADYNGEMAGGRAHWDYPPHVGMGAILFRRDRLGPITFRWSPGRCECQCCNDDLRRAGHAVGFHPAARAWHRRHPASAPVEARPPGDVAAPGPTPEGRVLTAFDRNHYRKFRRLFLRTLREAGNRETVTAVAYDLLPGEHRELAAIRGVEILARPSRGMKPAALRLEHFPEAMAGWPDNTPAAYWDAGDVLFQGRLGPLWEIVRAHPDRILAVREPIAFDQTVVNKDWVESIRDPESRNRLLALFSARPIINGGFVAGTARALRGYFREAVRIRYSEELRGSTGRGDQTTLNVFCHTNPDRWLEVSQGWNYCLCRRKMRDGAGLRVEGDDRTPVHVVHGNAGTLGFREVLHMHR
jgi:Glycosyl transferase family 2